MSYGDDVVYGIRRVDDNAFTGFFVAEQVDKVDHLLRGFVANGKVSAGKQLPEIDIAGILHVCHTMS